MGLKKWKTPPLKKILSSTLSLISLCLYITVLVIAAVPESYGASTVVRGIDISGLTRIDDEELRDLIGIETGDRLDPLSVQQGIRRAFKKGIFHDIQVISEPVEDGLRLTYHVVEIPLIKKVRVTGNERISSRLIRKQCIFKKHGMFREGTVHEAEQGLRNYFRRKGYSQANVTISATPGEDENTVTIHINVEEGPPDLIMSVDIPAEVRHMLEVDAGSVYDEQKIEKSLKRIRAYYRKKNYRTAAVGPVRFREGVLIIPVVPGDQLELVFKNNSAFSSRKLEKGLSPVITGEIGDEELYDAVDRLRSIYAAEGYHRAQVRAVYERSGDTVKAVFDIQEGQQATVRNVLFQGITLSEAALHKVVPFTPGEPFDQNRLDGSRDAIKGFYNALGYLDAEVTGADTTYLYEGTQVDLEYTVAEGEQTKIREIILDGNEHLSDSDILSVIHFEAGNLYNEVDISDARVRVASLYGSRGYLDAVVEVERRIDGPHAFIRFIIQENMQTVVGKIILQGNNLTKRKIVMREFSIREGDVYSTDKVIRTKQHLYMLGIFNEIIIEPVSPGVRRDNVMVKDMLVTLKEGNPGSVELSIGFGDYEKLRGSVDVRYNNLGGYHRQIGFRTELSAVEKKYIFNFREPWLFNWRDFPLKVFLIREETRSINIETRDLLYKIDKQSLIVGVEREIARGLKAGLDYEYSFTDTKEVEEDVILSKEDTGTLGIGSLSPSLFYDNRDNPFEPTSGSFNSVVVKYALPLFLSETKFIKGTFQSSWYVKVASPVVLALSLKGGVAHGFEETEEIPLIERFFLGGRSTVRGYKNDALGPKGEDGNATGGNVFTLANVESRISLGKGFGLVAFFDGGNVWETLGDVEASLKFSAGGGLRYSTPVGPIRVDYGHKLNRKEGESAGEFHFSFGHAF